MMWNEEFICKCNYVIYYVYQMKFTKLVNLKFFFFFGRADN